MSPLGLMCDHARVATEQETLYDDVQRRLAVATRLVEDLDASDEMKAALRERLQHHRWAAKSDLTRTSRRVDDLVEELRAGMLLAATE